MEPEGVPLRCCKEIGIESEIGQMAETNEPAVEGERERINQSRIHECQQCDFANAPPFVWDDMLCAPCIDSNVSNGEQCSKDTTHHAKKYEWDELPDSVSVISATSVENDG